jgi:CHASE2 domain-containing sensor protein
MVTIERRIRFASILVITGLLLELLSFRWKSPLSFFLFLVVACGIALIGIVIFFISLITLRQHRPPPPKPE